MTLIISISILLAIMFMGFATALDDVKDEINNSFTDIEEQEYNNQILQFTSKDYPTKAVLKQELINKGYNPKYSGFFKGFFIKKEIDF